LNVQEWQAVSIEHAAKALATGIETTPAERLDWQPTTEGSAKTRSILEQCGEVIGLNYMAASLLSGRGRPERPAEEPKLDGPTAIAQVQASAQALAAAVRALPDDQFNTVHDLGFAKLTSAQVMEIALGNMSYHWGQLNLIQLLYGDTEFHIPPDFFG
jgi:hypothetical protein